MATALQTFDVDTTRLQAALPQIGMGGASDVLTTSRVTASVQDAASELCGVLVAAGLSPSDIAADTDSIAYYQCQRIIVALAVPLLLRAVQGLGAGATAELDGLETRARDRLRRVEINPAILGWDVDGVTPGVYTTVSEHDDRSDTDPVVYRQWQDHEGDGPKW